MSKDNISVSIKLHDTKVDVPIRPAYRLLQDSAKHYPDRTALVATDRKLTYLALNEEANKVGRTLITAGVKCDSIVAVLADRNSYAYVMRQGVLKSGGAFLPIDPEYPEDRIHFILEDSNARHLITTEDIISRRKDLFDNIIKDGTDVISVEKALEESDGSNLDIDVPYESLAYVIYTSGSTGKPKGVMITNHNLVNFVYDDEKNAEIHGMVTGCSAVLAIAALTFDFAIMEEFVPIANGMTAVLATNDEIMNPLLLADLMTNNKVDCMCATPSYLLNLLDMSEFTDKLDIAISHVKAIDMGAEAFPPELFTKLKAVSPDILIMNGYGPTEATVSCTMQVIESPDDITIGIPNGNVNVVTMDKDGKVQPLGEVGELVIIGDGVGRGYIGRDDLTKEKFITLDGKRAYKSGDLARIREDGNIEFRGRIDNQVKLRGLRVELGEIESKINSFPGVNTSIVVVVKQDTEYLAAYYTASEEIEVEALKEHLSSKLTEYMVPQVFIQLDKMPLTANGKIDKKKLPSPTMQEVVIEPAQNQTQQEILDIAIDTLGTDRIGITTDLFAAGMSSISGMKFCALLSAKYNKDLRIADIADNSTVVDIEKLLDDSDELINYELRDEYPLSMNQMGIYIETELNQGTTIYNIPSLYKLDDRVDLDKLSKAIVKAASAHPYLFMILDKAGDRVVVKRRDDYQLEVKCTTCDKVPVEEELVRPFDLTSNEVLIRAELFDTKDGKYFFLDTHHIVSDGASIDILVEDIDKVYKGEEVSEETYTGFEYALDEERLRSSDKYNKAKEWYDSIFAGCSGETMPVTDGNDSEQLGILKDQLNVKADDIRAFCKKNNLTVNAFFTAAFGMAVKSYSAAEETIFSTIYNGRSDARLENSVSMLVKTFPVLFNPKQDANIVSVIKDTQSYLLNAMSNDIYSFAEVKNEYGINGDMIFAYQGDIDDIAIIGGFKSSYKLLNLSRFRMPIGIDVFLSGDKVIYESEYAPSLYSKYTIQGIINLLDVVSQEFMTKDKISDISLVSDSDIEAIKNVHDTIVNVPAKPAYRLMQDSAEKFPEKIAVSACDRKLTYKEFNEEANRVGRTLFSKGVKPDTIVAVLADRNSYAYVMRQGVLKSGGAFLPIDPEYPEDRIRFILEDSKAEFILTTSDILARRKDLFDALRSEGIEAIVVEDALKNMDSSNPNVDVPYDSLAYVIYTSGSTGKPKGVMLTNHNLVNFVYDDEKNAEIHGMVNGCSAVLAIAALTFDFAIMEEFVPLANGMTAVLATGDDIMNPLQLADVMTENKVDCMCATPSYLLNLLDMGEYTNKLNIALSHVKAIDMGAEAFPPVLYTKLKEVSPDILIMNGYGPTEATVSCTMQVIDNPNDITIGIPNGNVNVATMDREGHLQPLGAMGEMVIMGDGIGRGYIGRDDLNKKNFITLFGKKAYRSGDLVRIREDGNIEFHGRIDNQVKLRGLRVELGEIESNINSYPGIGTSIVIVVKQDTEYLAAYYTADEEIDTEDLKAHLSSKLTEYMVPQVLIQLDKMPLTANGKIDKKRLPSPTMTEVVIEPAKNDTQQAILDIAIEALGNDRIGITTDLFAAGMSSITCIKFCALLSSKFDKDVRIADVFDNKTVIDIEKLLNDSESAVDYELVDEYPLSMNQMGIYIESEMHQGTTIYNIPSLYKLDDRVDLDKLQKAIVKASSCHPYLFMMIEKLDDRIVVKRRDDYELEVPCKVCDKVPSEEELVRPFDLTSNEVLIRAELFDTKDGKYFFLDTHHIVSDGASIDILVEDIDKVYRGEEVVGETYTGFEYALDEERLRSSDKLSKAKEWYDSIFAGCSGESAPVTDGKSNEHVAVINSNMKVKAEDIRTFCEKNSVTANAFFVTAFGLTMQSYTASEDGAIFSTIYNGRSDSRLENSVSMLVKTFPVFFNPKKDSDVISAIRDCQSYLLNAMTNDIYSFAEVKNEYGINGDIVFAYQGDGNDVATIGGYETTFTMFDLSYSRAHIGIDLFLKGDEVVYEVEYDPSLYSEYTVKGIMNLIDNVSQQFISKDKISDVELVDNNDIDAIIKLHDTKVDVPSRPAYRLLQDSAAKYPEKVAVVATDRTLTYSSLNEEANRVGRTLAGAGVKCDSIVAVLADRNSYAYVMRQGVLKSGGAFLPIDPEYPEDRIRFVLEDSKAKYLITTEDIIDRRKDLFDSISSDGVKIISAQKALEESDGSNLDVEVSKDSLAYVIYTSGSTGKPKGVALTNGNLVNFVYDDKKNAETHRMVSNVRVLLAIAALTFDVSVMEECIPIANGMTVVLATDDEIMNPKQLEETMLANKVDGLCATPTYVLNLLDMGKLMDSLSTAISNLKLVDIGAEAFPPVLYDKLREVNSDVTIINGYGPTETTISCTMKEIDNPDDITIGIPNGNVNVATTDRDGRLQPLGAMGEMIIIGDGVGHGYIGRDDLSEKSFISMFGRSAYRSGDLVRIREDGDIEFHGRIDNQVKLRGLRVELGEIESNINSFPGISTSIVIVVKQDTEYLAAYYTADEEIDVDALKKHLSSKLTEYMVPQAFIQLDKMPLTANGKIDKKKLPSPTMQEMTIEPAENQTQQDIIDIAAELLGTDRIGITTDLFAAGMSSITCIKFCALLSSRFDKEVRLADVSANKTVAEIEMLLNETDEAISYEARDEYPLSMNQMGIYIESELHQDTTIYNIPSLYKLDDRVDLSKLKDAIVKAVSAHPYLFMRLEKVGDKVVVKRRDDYELEVKFTSCDKVPAEDELVRPYDLASNEVLIRAEIYDTKEGKYFFLDTHHIVSDGESIDILIEDIDKAYKGEEVSQETYTGFEYALDEERLRNSDKLTEAKEWYDSVFAGCSGETMPVTDGKGNEHVAMLHNHLNVSAEDVRAFCEKNNLTANAFFTAAFGMTMQSYTASEDGAIFSTIYNGRNDSKLENSVTMLVKTFPVYFNPKNDSSIVSVIHDAQTYLLNAMSHDIYSFAEIKNEYDINGDVLFAYQGDGEDVTTLGGYEATFTDFDLSYAKAPIGFDVSLDGDKVMYEVEYDPSMYSEFTMQGIANLLDVVSLEFMSKDKISDISLVSDTDIEAIKNVHDTIVNVPAKPAYRLMQDSAEKFPEKTAVAACDRKLTYKEFNEEANKVGHSLISRGVKPDTIVAVLADRNSYAYVMRQGVLKSGGAFLPIDPEYPEDRIRFILEDSKAKLILTTSDILTRRKDLFEALGSEGIEAIAAQDALKNNDSSNPNVDVPYDSLAYVIYTSGSTGKPKGVMLTNHNLVNFVYDDEKNAEIHGMVNGCNAVLAIAALTSDFAIMEEFVPLANGMTAVLATGDDIMNPLQLADVMTENKVDCMCATPSYLINLLDMGEYTDKLNKAISNVKAIDMGAEAFPPVLYTKLKAVSPDILIMNGYGPTEATVSCTMQVIDNPDDITIGIPNGNVNVATMDREGHLQPLGAMGEMVIIGDGIGRGYIGREDLNKKNFISLFGRNAYRSGDLVRIREDGNIEFHGRIDNQVKLRGLRVELGEIESNINSYPGIGTSIVIVVKQDTEYLAAYFTADEKIDTESLKEHLSSKLTEYMVPQVLIQLDKMPLTANGKIDKKKLPKPSMEQEEIVPPENETQQKILDIVASVLGKDSIGIKTDLFSAGLSSIGCIKLCSLLSNEFDKDIRISDVFDNRTIVEIEALLEETVEEIDLELRDEYPLTMTQMGIFVESMRFIGTTVYNIPFLYKLSDDIDMDKLKDAISTAFMAHPYIYMTIKNVDDDAVALRNEVHPIDVKIGDVLPSTEELIQPFDLLSGEELYRVSLYDTSDGKYLFIDLHHIIADGESFDILFEDINSAYEEEEVITEEFSGYEVGLTEQAFRSSSRFNKARSFYDGIFNGVSPVILPDEEKNPDTSREDYSSVISKVAAKSVKDYCEEKELSLNAFFTAAFGLALKSYTGADKSLFATIYNGRSDSRTSRSVTMLVKTLPVLLEAHTNDTVVKYITECQNYLINAMANDIVSFSELSSSYGLDSDILFAYQGEGDDDVVLGGRKATEVSVDLDQEKSPFGLDISIQDDNVIYDFECDNAKYGTFTIDRFSELLDAIVDGFISKSSMAEVMNIETVKKLTKESVKTSSAKEEKVSKVGSVSGEANKVYVDTFVEIMKKVLGASSVGPDDNFFQIGGTSLSAAKVMMAAMSIDLPVLYKDIFDHPTPRELALLVDEKNELQFGVTEDAASSKGEPEDADIHEEAEKALMHNSIEYVDEITREDIGNVLLVGASGFLGIHILDELLESCDNKIYCLMHSNGKSSRERLKQVYFYYFDKAYDDEWDNRVEVIEADITDPDSLEVVKQYDFKTVINCAAIVKHFGDINVLKKVNTDGVINLAKLCLATNSRLIHVSTVSVGGDSIGDDAKMRTLYEWNLDIGQEVESNAYVYTKYLAEKYLVEAIKNDGLDAKIMRVGNLMSRFSDGEFQVNFHTNNFMNTLKAYVTLGCFPVEDLDVEDEFSPIDEVAKAIVTLSGADRKFNVFHVYNSHGVEMGDVIYALKDMGYNIDIVKEAEFTKRLRDMISDEKKNQYISPLVNYNLDDDDIRVENDSDNSFTVKALYRLGFKWSLTSTDYIETTMDMLSAFGFFDINPD